MRNRIADEFERHLRGSACARGRHAQCRHLCGFAVGLNPRRLRFESGAGLCKCDCHSFCPVTSKRMTVNWQAWHQSCTCPGAEAERIRWDQAGLEFPDFDERLARARQVAEARRAAFRVVRASTPGKSREEIRARYLAELRSRGVEEPPDAILEADVYALTGDYLASARILGRSVVNFVRALSVFRPPS